MRILSRKDVRILAAGAFSSSASMATPGDPPAVIEAIPIESVDVRVGSTRPAFVTALFTGSIGSGCDFLHSITQRREGAVVTIDIQKSRFTKGPCTMIFKAFEQELGLPGGFDAGEYTLRVNGESRSFTVPETKP
jgi:hypothetical protein